MDAQIVVVGGGVAGLTTALALSDRGFSSCVLERGNFTDESGAGIQLTPNATSQLFQLGLETSLVTASHEAHTLESRHWRTGRVVSKVPLREIIQKYCEFPFLQIRRSDLINILRQKCEEQTNIELFSNVEVSAISQSKDEVKLHSSKKQFSTPMVVGADGIHSTMSALIGNLDTPKFSGWQAWRTILNNPELPRAGLAHTNVWCGAEGHVVHYPVNMRQSYNCVFVTKSSKNLSGKWKQNGSVSELRNYFRGWHDNVIELIDQIKSESLFRWGLFHHAKTKNSWSNRRIVLLGDAIHATMPFLAQGAALAIEDACALANRLKLHSVNVEQAIESFVKYRKQRVERIQTRSERMGNVYHLNPPWSRIRDLATTWAVHRLAKDIYRFKTS